MGNLFSNNKYLFDEFIKIQPSFETNIGIIKNLIIDNDKYSKEYILNIKNNAINEINNLKNNFDTYWKDYDLKYFQSKDIQTLIQLIKIKKEMCYHVMTKISSICDSVNYQLSLEYEIDNTKYKI